MQKNKRPNIIYLVCHDLGKELGCYGKPIETPNLNAFAKGGIKFTNYFCNSPACMPSRCCAYTGLYAHTNGVMGLPTSNYSLDEKVKTVVDYFNDGGYETVHVGFQHERESAAANRYQIELHKGSQDCHAETAVDTAIEYLKNHKGKDKPFYLNIGTAEVHASQWQDQTQRNNKRKEIYGTTPYEDVHMPAYIPDVPVLRKEMGNFQACIRYFDKQAGRLLNAIREMGYEDDTIVICTTDHGISNEHAKGTLYDAGVEIMLLIQLPGAEKTGTVIDHLIQNIDMAPTLLEAAGIPVPVDMQGNSFWPLLSDKNYVPHAEIYTERNYHGPDLYDPMRSVRTKNFHYIRNFDKQSKKQWIPSEIPYMNETYVNYINELWPENRLPRDEEELYDIINDPNELYNLAYEKEYQNIRFELSAKLDNWMQHTSDPILNGPIISPKRKQRSKTMSNINELRKSIKPGEVWLDTDGNPIQAHGGGILYIDGIYYWYGENKSTKTDIIPYIPVWHNKTKKQLRYRTDLIGISCYSSKDLINWENEGIVLPAVKDDPNHDLWYKNVLERPKVVYNQKTKQYVMWMHVETYCYQYARAGVAVSDSPTGPFKYIGSVRPNDNMSRDMSLFQDDDGKAYLIFSSEANATMHISLLTEDYLEHTGVFTRNFIDQRREAPAMFKHQNKYYLITSGCSGWAPNMAKYAVADSPLGPWELLGNPCIGEDADLTFKSQSTHVLPVAGLENSYIFMADRWNNLDLGDSRYIWLPLFINDGNITIKWMDEWNLDVLKVVEEAYKHYSQKY